MMRHPKHRIREASIARSSSMGAGVSPALDEEVNDLPGMSVHWAGSRGETQETGSWQGWRGMIRSRGEFIQRLREERNRSDRSGSPFCLILVSMGGPGSSSGSGQFLLRALETFARSVRLSDVLGWYSEEKVGLLFHTFVSDAIVEEGVLILIGIGVSTLLWFDWSNRFVWIVMLVTMGFGAIGWVDDWRKVVDKNTEGMASREKFFWQSLIGLFAALYLAFSVSETSFLGVLQLFIRWVSSGFSTELPPKADLLMANPQTARYKSRAWRQAWLFPIWPFAG